MPQNYKTGVYEDEGPTDRCWQCGALLHTDCPPIELVSQGGKIPDAEWNWQSFCCPACDKHNRLICRGKAGDGYNLLSQLPPRLWPTYEGPLDCRKIHQLIDAYKAPFVARRSLSRLGFGRGHHA